VPEYFPVGQLEQLDALDISSAEAPALDWYVPAAQSEQELEPEAPEYFPAGQLEQFDAPNISPELYLPMAHAAHVLDADAPTMADAVPAGHPTQSLDVDGVVAYVPAGQLVQLDDPGITMAAVTVTNSVFDLMLSARGLADPLYPISA